MRDSTVSTPAELISKCKRCSKELAPAALVCEHCHALVHAAEIEGLANEARALEETEAPRNALEKWRKALELLPPDVTQAEWVRGKIRRLEIEVNTPTPPAPERPWLRMLGPLAPVALLLFKSKALLSLFKANFLVSLAGFLAVYWNLYGMKFGIGFAAQVFIHEMGHFIDIRRRGLPADMPVFLPGLGAYVRWRGMGVSGETHAAISLAGPLAGLFAAMACALAWWTTGDPFWAALARSGAWLNVLNLIPVWALDGGQALQALGKSQRWLLLTASVASWLFLGESIFLLVALGAIYRLFTKDLPAQPSRAITAYFVIVLVALGVVMRLMPGEGFGAP